MDERQNDRSYSLKIDSKLNVGATTTITRNLYKMIASGDVEALEIKAHKGSLLITVLVPLIRDVVIAVLAEAIWEKMKKELRLGNKPPPTIINVNSPIHITNIDQVNVYQEIHKATTIKKIIITGEEDNPPDTKL